MRRIFLLQAAAWCGLALAASFADAQQAGTQRQPRRDNQVRPTNAVETQAGGQAAPQDGRSNSVSPGAQAGMARSADQELAACLIIDNQSEVDAGKFALAHSQNQEVKQFAQQMVDQHSQMIQKLQPFAGALAAATQAGTNAGGTNAGGTNAAAGRQAGGLDHVAFKRELAAQCKQTMERELGQKQGAEFDKCYMGAQVQMHLHAIDTMKVAQNHSSAELRAALDEGIAAATQHLEHAKTLAKQFEGRQPAAQR